MPPINLPRKRTKVGIQTLVRDTSLYAFGERTPGRGKLKPGDWMCFYASGKGVAAHAKVSSAPEKKP